MSTDTREQLLLIFERHRATPGAPYEPERFLDFLLAEPAKARAIYDSFSGLWRYNRFVNDLQLQFGIHLSTADFNANYSLDKFVDRIGALQASPRSSMSAYGNAERGGFGWLPVLAANGVIAVASLYAWRRIPALALVLLAVALLGNLAVARWYLGWRQYRNRLHEKIKGAGPPP